ncbi:MAG: 3-phosphoshikimate 1-carboxyvinyltransferase [Phaeodactylibacter xiamenensis]|uniref:3-phosphoshikimate 1-carboxyvinyltransferase n=2 Tax=Phaeodactylibacter xiamenensis TaxID=1524460 RepID=A0A098SE01_9BACT|nr:3-phosphoshikimate 1-carboxyvinyltransferase [Phaeodactylibacter xiamenensis]KGE89873.1 3-phosphoshikimate 1-carboxyvinyltransferase [Phaeodactylibacter xiamenensis]MCR9055345.1 3-phosphoshikimate 1-carboxyvinyltransferase [bacterium]
MTLTLSRPEGTLTGEITLAGSKSISNRALMIRALSGADFPIHKLANARDTVLLEALLQTTDHTLDAGAAGTTFRFLTAYLSMQPGEQVLTGTERMKQRPIGVLVDALRKLGAKIDYLEQQGYPPLRIGAPDGFGKANTLSIAANTSSQYISALLMLAPTLPEGLRLQLEGEIVSRPYIEMTLSLMSYFGVSHQWEEQTIIVPPQSYVGKPFTVEADWSAASYYYAMAAIAPETDLRLNGLFRESVQGDAVLSEMMTEFGVETHFDEAGVRLKKRAGAEVPDEFTWDFLKCPDLAQTLAVCCAAVGTSGTFCGLETLRIKETDRILALQQELQKVNANLIELPPTGERTYFQTQGKTLFGSTPTFATYEDHRMAMAFAPLAMQHPIEIEEPEVVVKSYPDFWKDLQKIGFEVVR